MSEINAFLTKTCNGHRILPSERKFLRRCLIINFLHGLPFCYLDFPSITQTNFRQLVYRLQKFIKKTHEGRPTYYKIVGVPYVKNPPNVTDDPTEPVIFEKIFETLEFDELKIHDLKLGAHSNLHEFLENTSMKQDPNNKGYKIRFNLAEDTTAKIMVYPQKIQIDIACSEKPIFHDISGVIRLTFLLGNLCGLLRQFAPRLTITPYDEWDVLHYHIGRDSSSEFTGNIVQGTAKDLSIGFVRVYIKKFNDGKNRIRVEKIVTPNISLGKEIEKILSLPNAKFYNS